jgi:hypothetical protein
VPDLLTVEEAAGHLRVGRTKAYAMAQEWRTTSGQRGLPVVDFGHVLRVPRQALEKMLGTELTRALAATPTAQERSVPAPQPVPSPTSPPPRRKPSQSTKTTRPRRATTTGQLDLFTTSG